jgi:hypothetical protein
MKTLTIKMPTQRQLHIPLVVLAGVLILLFVFGFQFTRSLSLRLQLMKGWQAVYLVNGDLYVGKLRTYDDQTMELHDAYYVSLDAQGGNGGQAPSIQLQSGGFRTVSLLQWGFNQPLISEGILNIQRSNMLFWESLNDDAEIVQQIKAARE